MKTPHAARLVSQIDWTSWQPDDVATLLFVVQRVSVLLIRKKRGLGAGKINAPGGRLQVGETPLAAAVREVEEELVITPHEIVSRGTLSFQFVDGYSLHAHVFVASGYNGSPTETDEAIPHWFPLTALPYEEMWEDDALWLPEVLAGRSVTGRFIFDGEQMLDHELVVSIPARPVTAASE